MFGKNPDRPHQLPQTLRNSWNMGNVDEWGDLRLLLLRQLNTTPIVIPAKAGIQAYTGCRIKSGMTAVLI
jgi:hypothetical protein